MNSREILFNESNSVMPIQGMLAFFQLHSNMSNVSTLTF